MKNLIDTTAVMMKTASSSRPGFTGEGEVQEKPGVAEQLGNQVTRSFDQGLALKS